MNLHNLWHSVVVQRNFSFRVVDVEAETKGGERIGSSYERREFPYPGDTDAMEDFVAKGGMVGTMIAPKKIVESEGEADNYRKEMEKKV